MSFPRPSLAALTVSLLFLAACAKKGEGEPCSSNSECASGLTCDKHGQATGKCRGPHHEPLSDSGVTAPDSSAIGGTGGTTAGPDAAGGAAGADAATSNSDTASPPDTATIPVDAAPDRAPDTGASNCASYCMCMMQSCAGVNGYPFANNAACLTRCGQFKEMELTCFSRFCSMAAMQNQSAREHTCEHAWAALGAAECM